jgi:hypothetical protein
MTKTFKFTKHDKTYTLSVVIGKYLDGNTTLELWDMDDQVPYAIASVNMPNVLLCDNEVLIKDYSENEGILEFLVQNNIVTKTQSGVELPFNNWLSVCVINPEEKWGTPVEVQPEPIEAAGDNFVWEIQGYKITAKTYAEARELVPYIKAVDF